MNHFLRLQIGQVNNSVFEYKYVHEYEYRYDYVY